MILNPAFNDQAALEEVLANRGRDHGPLHPACYEDCVVLKPWGHEFQMFDDHRHALWLLHIVARRATSLHCHLHKTARFIPLTEGFQLVTLSGVIPVAVGEQVVANPGVFHSVWNSAFTDGELLEMENPSIKHDLVRASDAWGREKEGYEGERHIVRTELDRYGYCELKEDRPVLRLGHEISVGDDGFHIRRTADV